MEEPKDGEWRRGRGKKRCRSLVGFSMTVRRYQGEKQTCPVIIRSVCVALKHRVTVSSTQALYAESNRALQVASFAVAAAAAAAAADSAANVH